MDRSFEPLHRVGRDVHDAGMGAPAGDQDSQSLTDPRLRGDAPYDEKITKPLPTTSMAAYRSSIICYSRSEQ